MLVSERGAVMERLKCNHCGEWTVNPHAKEPSFYTHKSPFTGRIVFDPIVTISCAVVAIGTVALLLGY